LSSCVKGNREGTVEGKNLWNNGLKAWT